jgi:CxxC-x17-CxxC domain-containing protein
LLKTLDKYKNYAIIVEMNNFKSGPGGLRGRKEFIGGRPKGDANYGPKKRFESNDRGPRRDDRGGERKMELFATTCTTCGKSCEVPFRPDGSKPVLCRDCFAAKNAGGDNTRGNDRFASNDRPQRKPERTFDSPRPDRAPSVSKEDHIALARQVAMMETKISEILEIVKGAHVKVPKLPVAVEASTVEALVEAKVRKPKKLAVAKKAAKGAKKAATKVIKKAK